MEDRAAEATLRAAVRDLGHGSVETPQGWHRVAYTPTIVSDPVSLVIQQRIGTLLGNFGLVPLAVLAAASWLPLDATPAQWVALALIGYAAVILSFLGAVHWGLALLTPQLDKPATWNALGWGVLPSLLGWLALLLAVAGIPTWLVLLFLIGDLALCWLMDRALWPLYPHVPGWYLPLRGRLTAVAVLSLALALPATL